MENLLLQTKEYVKELMVYRFKSVIPSLEKTDNFPILVNDFMDKGILLWLWILPDGRAIYFSNNKKFGILIKCPDNIEVISSNFPQNLSRYTMPCIGVEYMTKRKMTAKASTLASVRVLSLNSSIRTMPNY